MEMMNEQYFEEIYNFLNMNKGKQFKKNPYQNTIINILNLLDKKEPSFKVDVRNDSVRSHLDNSLLKNFRTNDDLGYTLTQRGVKIDINKFIDYINNGGEDKMIDDKPTQIDKLTQEDGIQTDLSNYKNIYRSLSEINNDDDLYKAILKMKASDDGEILHGLLQELDKMYVNNLLNKSPKANEYIKIRKLIKDALAPPIDAEYKLRSEVVKRVPKFPKRRYIKTVF